jgi:hypothetical protein
VKIIIEIISNGVVVKYPDEDKISYVFDNDKPEQCVEMLYNILDTLGMSGSRYDKKRIYIKIEHGDKYECKDKKCEICRS